MKSVSKNTVAFVACLAIAGIAYAAVTIDYNTGVGFAGKGDVQLACGFNNAQLQAWGDGAFRVAVNQTTVTEVEWTCTNSNNQNEQIRERTTTSSLAVTGVLSQQARVKNQITGYNLNGFNGVPTTSSTTSTEGPAVNSCPSGPWTLTAPAGDPILVSSTSTGGVEVFCNGGWVAIN